MRFSLFAMIRLMVILAGASALVAVGVARMEPKEWHYRIGVPPHYSVINGFSVSHWPGRLGFLDAETGQFAKILMPDEDRMEFGSCSPWEDENGESQVVGRWIHEVGDGVLRCCDAVGVARYSLPSGRVLDRVPLNVMPAASPCWFPGFSPKVLFAAADGLLYTVTFSDRSESADEPTVRAITWRCPAPGKQVFLKDPVWPTDPRLGGRLIVTLSYQTAEPEVRNTQSQLWWISLNSEGTTIVDAGELVVPEKDSRPNDVTEVRFPNLAVTPEGDLVLTYLWQTLFKDHWELRYSTVSATESTAPTIVPGSSRSITKNHSPTLAPFSADGRWIFSLVKNEQGSPEVVRVSTAPLSSDDD